MIMAHDQRLSPGRSFAPTRWIDFYPVPELNKPINVTIRTIVPLRVLACQHRVQNKIPPFLIRIRQDRQYVPRQALCQLFEMRRGTTARTKAMELKEHGWHGVGPHFMIQALSQVSVSHVPLPVVGLGTVFETPQAYAYPVMIPGRIRWSLDLIEPSVLEGKEQVLYMAWSYPKA